MKNSLDFCKIQWLNKELFPKNYFLKYNKNESRFYHIFKDSKNKYSNNNNFNDNNNNINITFNNKLNNSYNNSEIDNSNKNNIIIYDNNNHNNNYYNNNDNNILNNINNNKICNNNSINIVKKNQKPNTYEINIKKILTFEDKRTTLMIRNIPNKFTKDNFLYLFNKEFEGKFNCFLLPTDFNEKKNFGYCFINFLNPLDIIYFYYRFNGKNWPGTNSKKICEIIYSKIQGINKMIRHYPIKSIFIKNDSYLDCYENISQANTDDKSNSSNNSNNSSSSSSGNNNNNNNNNNISNNNNNNNNIINNNNNNNNINIIKNNLAQNLKVCSDDMVMIRYKEIIIPLIFFKEFKEIYPEVNFKVNNDVLIVNEKVLHY